MSSLQPIGIWATAEIVGDKATGLTETVVVIVIMDLAPWSEVLEGDVGTKGESDIVA